MEGAAGGRGGGGGDRRRFLRLFLGELGRGGDDLLLHGRMDGWTTVNSSSWRYLFWLAPAQFTGTRLFLRVVRCECDGNGPLVNAGIESPPRDGVVLSDFFFYIVIVL